MLRNQPTIVESKLYAVQCRSLAEASYLAAIINSVTLEKEVAPLMSKGQFGARDVQKHIWRLPIPEYDETEKMHQALSETGVRLTEEAEMIWNETRAEREASGKSTSVTIARRVLREWQAESPVAKQAEQIVARLIR